MTKREAVTELDILSDLIRNRSLTDLDVIYNRICAVIDGLEGYKVSLYAEKEKA